MPTPSLRLDLPRPDFSVSSLSVSTIALLILSPRRSYPPIVEEG